MIVQPSFYLHQIKEEIKKSIASEKKKYVVATVWEEEDLMTENLTEVLGARNNTDLRADITGEIGTPIKVAGVGLCLRVMDVCVCPLREMIRLVWPKTLQVCADIEAECVCLAVVGLTGAKLSRSDNQNL